MQYHKRCCCMARWRYYLEGYTFTPISTNTTSSLEKLTSSFPKRIILVSELNDDLTIILSSLKLKWILQLPLFISYALYSKSNAVYPTKLFTHHKLIIGSISDHSQSWIVHTILSRKIYYFLPDERWLEFKALL